MLRHDKIFFAKKRACSSMAEQWPFKPLVERSSRSTLTFYLHSWLLHPQGVWDSNCSTRTFCLNPWLVAVPAGGSTFEPLHVHFLFIGILVAAPTGGVESHKGTRFEPLHTRFRTKIVQVTARCRHALCREKITTTDSTRDVLVTCRKTRQVATKYTKDFLLCKAG